jgi:predicted nucleic acid-binding protein
VKTGGNVMNRKFVIDSSVYLIYASHGKIYRLLDAIVTYDLIVYVNQDLLSELNKNIPKVIRVDGVKADEIVNSLKVYTIEVKTVRSFIGSPDPKDNFLFDLALQTGSEVIVTQEKALLAFKDSPVPVHNLKWFKENYPVPL